MQAHNVLKSDPAETVAEQHSITKSESKQRQLVSRETTKSTINYALQTVYSL